MSMRKQRLQKILDSVEAQLGQRTLTVDGNVHPFYGFKPLASMPEQSLFMRSEAKMQVLWGGNRSGKTLCGDQKCATYALGFDPLFPNKKFRTPCRIWLCCRPQDTRETFRDFKARIPRERVVSEHNSPGRERLELDNGSVIKIKSYGMKKDEFQREAVDIVRWDEEGEEDIYDECITRLVSTNGMFILTFTPIKGTTWMHKKLRQLDPKYANLLDGDFAHFNVTPRKNSTIDPEAMRRWEESLENESAVDVRINGKYILLAGSLIFEKVTERLRNDSQTDPIHGLKFDIRETPVRETIKNPKNYRRWRVWEEPIPFAAYVIGADVAKGTGGDYSTAHVVSAETGAVVAVFASNEITPADFANELRMMGKLYNRALLAPEINSEGCSVLDTLREYGYSRIYRRKSYGGRVKQIGNDEGWMTSRTNKEAAIEGLRVALVRGLDEKPGGVRLFDEHTIQELANFGHLNETRPGAHGLGPLSGSRDHDDRVMSLAIAVQALEQAPVSAMRRTGRGAVAKMYLEDWKNELLREGLATKAEQEVGGF